MENRLAEHEDKLQKSDEVLAEILTMQEKLQSRITSLEAYSRLKMPRIYGVSEGTESGSQSMILFVGKLIRENISIPTSTGL